MAGFAQVLRLLRVEKGLSQQELANALKISKSSVNMYERGERQPNFETLELIADYFNVDIDYLLGRTNKTTKIIQPDTLAALFDAQNFTEDELDEIMNFVEFVKNKRMSEKERLIKYSELLPNAAHERTDIDVTDEMRKHDDDIMDDENF
ncbi:MAG: helix-turn-helix transcriptional regulator [Eubacterium sp.]|nr:helix-turn-helix transcriptional regulator [Eubacterium sp.]